MQLNIEIGATLKIVAEGVRGALHVENQGTHVIVRGEQSGATNPIAEYPVRRVIASVSAPAAYWFHDGVKYTNAKFVKLNGGMEIGNGSTTEPLNITGLPVEAFGPAIPTIVTPDNARRLGEVRELGPLFSEPFAPVEIGSVNIGDTMVSMSDLQPNSANPRADGPDYKTVAAELFDMLFDVNQRLRQGLMGAESGRLMQEIPELLDRVEADVKDK